MTPQTIILDSPERRERAQRIIASLPQEVVWDVSIKPYEPQRTNAQNARLWKLHTLASEVAGYTPEEMHEEALCAHFGYSERECKNPWTGEIEVRKVPNKRSSQRRVKEFAQFMEATEMLYIEKLGVFLG